MHQVGANKGATAPHKISSEKSTPVAQGNPATVTVRKTKSTRKKVGRRGGGGGGGDKATCWGTFALGPKVLPSTADGVIAP